LGKQSASLREEKHRVEDSAIHLLAADLAAFVLFLKPAHQRFEVFHHRTSGDVFAGRSLQRFALIVGAAFFQKIVQPRTHFFVIGIVTRSRRLACRVFL
jgi:hypothetical protein